MNETYALDGVQSVLAYPFKQPNWQSKFAVGIGLVFASYFIPFVPGIFIAGYFAKIMHAVITEGAEPSLPEWENWGDLFNRGAKVVVATLIYLFPALALIIGGYLMMYVPLMVSSFSLESSSGHYGQSTGLFAAAMVGIFVGLAMLLLGLVLYCPLLFILPPALAHLIANNSFRAAFRIREWVRIVRANSWGFFAALSVITGVFVVLSMIVYTFYFTLILAVFMYIGIAIISVYAGAIAAPFLGQAYRKGVRNLAETVSE